MVKRILLSCMLMAGIFGNAQHLLKVLEGQNTITYKCDAENFAKTTVKVKQKWRDGNVEEITYICARHYLGSHTIQYGFLYTTYAGEWDLYYMLQPKIVTSGQEVKVLLAERHYYSDEGLYFQDVGIKATIE